MGRAGSGLQCDVPESTPQQHRLSEDAVETAEGGMSCCTAEATGTAGSWASCVCPHSSKLKSYVSIIELYALEILVTHSVVVCGSCQVQREVIGLVPNLISCLEEVDGDGSYASVRGSSPGAGN